MKTRRNVINVHVDGTCCLKIFTKSRHRGPWEILPVGHNSGYDISRIRSFRFFECE